MNQQSIFITARFRTGSTMLWNLFRQMSEVKAYIEPLHEQLLSYLQYPIQPQKEHFFINSYFDEYIETPKAKVLFKSKFANDRLYLESDDSHTELYLYIKEILNSIPENLFGVFKFNRIDFRLPWIRKNFPNSYLIHLVRNPRDQWYSTVNHFTGDIDKEIDLDVYSLATWARDLYKQFPFLASPQIEHAYQRFYYIWKLSFLAGQRLANISLNYEDILRKPEENISSLLNNVSLYSNDNLVKCLRFINSQPQRSWSSTQNNDWFLYHERKCEKVLDQLGLNQLFCLKPLTEIQQSSSLYQEMLLDRRNLVWAEMSFKNEIACQKSQNYEQNFILSKEIKIRDKIIEELKSYLQNSEQNSPKYNDLVGDFSIMQLKHNNLIIENSSLQNRYHQLKDEHEKILLSRSFRLTMPIRYFFGKLRTLKKTLIGLFR